MTCHVRDWFCHVKMFYVALQANMYCIYLWSSVLVLEKPSSSFELATEKLKSLNKNISWTGGNKYLHCFKMSVISFINIVKNFGKVSAFVVRKPRPLKVLRSIVLGLCCRSLRNICSSFYLKNKNKLLYISDQLLTRRTWTTSCHTFRCNFLSTGFFLFSSC